LKTVNTHIHSSLIEKSKQGDQTAQQALYELYIDAMYNTCKRMVGKKEDAEEILQDAFVKAFSNLNSFRYESTFGAWLKRIVVNQSINFLNKRNIPFSPLEKEEYRLAEPESFNQKPDISLVKKAITQLSDGYRRIISLYLFEGYDHQEISEITGLSVSTSKSQYHRAKKQLVKIINQ